MWRGVIVAAVLALAVAAPAAAAEPVAGGGPWLSVTGGVFSGEETTGRLEDEGTGPAFALTGGYRFLRYTSVEAGLELWWRSYSTRTVADGGPFVALDSRMDVDSLAIPVGLRVQAPLGPLEPFAAIGVDLVWSQLTLTGSTFGLPVERTERDFGAGWHWAVGTDLRVTEPLRLVFEYRRVALDGDFGDLTGGSVELGGQMLTGGVRLVF